MIDDIEILILGSGNAFADAGYYQAAHLVRYRTGNTTNCILLDCGPTILVSLIQNNVDLSTINLLLISHLHGDHIAGIPFLLLHYKYKEQKREKIFEIVGPPGLQNRINMLIEATYPTIFENTEKFYKVTEINIGESIKYEEILISAYQAVHIENSIFFKIKISDLTVAYSGDNQFTASIHLDIIKNDVDVLIHECSFMELDVGGHTSWRMLKTHIDEILSNVQTVILVHLGSDVRNASADNFLPNIFRAKDGDIFRIKK